MYTRVHACVYQFVCELNVGDYVLPEGLKGLGMGHHLLYLVQWCVCTFKWL